MKVKTKSSKITEKKIFLSQYLLVAQQYEIMIPFLEELVFVLSDGSLRSFTFTSLHSLASLMHVVSVGKGHAMGITC